MDSVRVEFRGTKVGPIVKLGLMAYINYAPMRIGTEDPWAFMELAKAGGPGGAQPPQPRGGLGCSPHLGNLPLRALVCDGAITGWLGYG